MGTYPWMWILLSSAVRVTDEGVGHCGIAVHLSKVSVSGDWGKWKEGRGDCRGTLGWRQKQVSNIW